MDARGTAIGGNLMGQSSLCFFQKQGDSFQNRQYFQNNSIEDLFFDEQIPLQLVGFAQSLVRLCKKRDTTKLNLPNTYFSKLWKISVASVDRKLSQLEEFGVIHRITSEGDKDIEGNWFRTRVIHVRCSKNFPTETSKLRTHKTTNSFRNLTRTLPSVRKVEAGEVESFLEIKSLKEIPASKKRKPSDAVKVLQKRFLKNALEKIIDEDELNYRFMCLILRQVLGAENPAIAHFGEKLFFQLKHKPELVISTLELMISSFKDIKTPIGWFISELQSVCHSDLGIHNAEVTGSNSFTSTNETSKESAIHSKSIGLKRCVGIESTHQRNTDTQDLGTGERTVDYESNARRFKNQLSPQGRKALERMRNKFNDEHL